MGDVDSGPLLSLVIPVFNEEESIESFVQRVSQVFEEGQSLDFEFVFVNDGSTDATLEKILDCQKQDSRIVAVDLSRNFGKEAALTAGLHEARGRAVAPIDGDLQHPPELIPKMLAKWREGYEVVLARRVDRKTDPWAKKFSAFWFYQIHNKISRPKLPENVGDFRLMDRSVVEALKQMPESRRFMKGLFAWVGFKTICVDYTCSERQSGKTKFHGRKLWSFALEGITSFSVAPLRLWFYLGLGVSLASFLYGLVIIFEVMFQGVRTPGYASLMVTITFLGGLQLIGIGVLGEYLGRTYMESKRRPSFIVRRVYQSPSTKPAS